MKLTAQIRLNPTPAQADALRRTNGSLARSAEALCIAKTTLHDKIRKYGLGEGGE